MHVVSEAVTWNCSIERKRKKLAGMWGDKLVSQNKNQKVPENALYFKRRITAYTYLQLTPNI